jgi:hypothetical protein
LAVSEADDWRYRVEVSVRREAGGTWVTVPLPTSTPETFPSRGALGKTFPDVVQAMFLGRLSGAFATPQVPGGAVYRNGGDGQPLEDFGRDFPDARAALAAALPATDDQRPVTQVWLRVWCSRLSPEGQQTAGERRR